ncbi:hypothetical protein C8J57DRAFT_10049 [Mycena rebaudengoi]|nr:hypothetical protein C8J57DRAFT_10049 [Mycena rebaudengoi]
MTLTSADRRHKRSLNLTFMSTTTSASAASAPEESTASSLLHRIPTQKISSFVRLKSLRRDKPPPLIFPPPSWSLDETKNDGAGASADLLHPPPVDTGVATDEPDAPEPHTFAKRIGTLIDALPPPAHTKDADIGVVDPKGPTFPSVVDSKLMRLLSSEDVMNGSRASGRQSVWSMLEKLTRRRTPQAEVGIEPKKDEVPQVEEREDEGIMMYAPLEPTKDSELELADSEMELEYIDEPVKAPAPEVDTKISQQPDKPSDKKADTAETPKGRPGKRKAKEQIHWVPSPTKISLQVMWWGYRLYLPPPVMKTLDNSHLAAAKRGAMITAALKWILDKVPMMMIPPPLRPAMMVLKRLTPYLGYVGVFIASAWTAIKARDKGDGVCLSATWLLPVALVPASLKPADFGRHETAAVPVDAGKKADKSGETVPAKTADTDVKSTETVPVADAKEEPSGLGRWMSFRREKSKKGK